MASIGWIDFSANDRNRVGSVLVEYPAALIPIRHSNLALDNAGVRGHFSWIFHIRENQQGAYNQAKIAAQATGVIVLENNPSFEMWLLLHFLHTGRLFNNCNEVLTELRRNGRIPNYDKSETFLLNARLYKTYKERIEQYTIPNARLLENNRADQDQLFPRGETFRFFEWYFENGV